MNCIKIQEQLSPYLDGELKPEELAQVEAHLKECPACRLELEGLRETVGLFRGLASREITARQDFRQRVLEQLKAEGTLHHPARSYRYWGLAGAAAVVLLALWGLGVFAPGLQVGQVADSASIASKEAVLPGSPSQEKRAMLAPEKSGAIFNKEESYDRLKAEVSVSGDGAPPESSTPAALGSGPAETAGTASTAGEGEQSSGPPVLTITGQPADKLLVRRLKIDLQTPEGKAAEELQRIDYLKIKGVDEQKVVLEVAEDRLEEFQEELSRLGKIVNQQEDTEDLTETVRRARSELREMEQQVSTADSLEEERKLAEKRRQLAELEAMAERVLVEINLIP